VNVVWSSLALIITFFYTDVFKLNPAYLAMLGLIPRLIDAFADVAMGMYTDSHSTRWAATAPISSSSPSLWAGRHAGVHHAESVRGRQAGLGICDVHSDMLVFTAVTIPYISLPGVLTADPQERLSANGYRLFFAKGAALMVTTFVPLFAAKWGPEQIARGYQVSMAIMAGAATLLFIFCFFTTTERVVHKDDRKPLWPAARLALQKRSMDDSGLGCLIGTIGYVIAGRWRSTTQNTFWAATPTTRVGVYHHGGDRHICHGRLHVDHEEVLQDPALPLVNNWAPSR